MDQARDDFLPRCRRLAAVLILWLFAFQAVYGWVPPPTNAADQIAFGMAICWGAGDRGDAGPDGKSPSAPSERLPCPFCILAQHGGLALPVTGGGLSLPGPRPVTQDVRVAWLITDARLVFPPGWAGSRSPRAPPNAA